jgi:hypothetical protein
LCRRSDRYFPQLNRGACSRIYPLQMSVWAGVVREGDGSRVKEPSNFER